MENKTQFVSEGDKPLVVCASPMSPSWRWFSHLFTEIQWQFFSAHPRNWLERRVHRPNLAATRSCWNAIEAARRDKAALLISLDPRVTFRCETFMHMRRFRIPHVAWGFNFNSLPHDRLRRLMERAFRRVDRFVVFSTMEKAIYSKYFGLDPDRIDVLLWGVGPPKSDPPDAPVEQGDYIAAVGGNSRDYRTLFAAMKRLPEIPLVAVLRPYNVANLEVPPNVRLHFNIASDKANNILQYSRFMVLPLAGSDVPCGHVTLVAAMYFHRAMIISDSQGIADYVKNDENGLLVPVGDADVLSRRISELWNDPALCRRLGEVGYAFAVTNCSESSVIAHLRKVLLEYGLPG